MTSNTNPTDGTPFYAIPSAPKIRHLLKPHLRIVIFTLTIATFVTMTDYLIQAISLELHK